MDLSAVGLDDRRPAHSGRSRLNRCSNLIWSEVLDFLSHVRVLRQYFNKLAIAVRTPDLLSFLMQLLELPVTGVAQEGSLFHSVA